MTEPVTQPVVARVVQRTGRGSSAWNARLQGITLVFALILVIGGSLIYQAAHYTLASADTHPDRDPSAITGEPVVAEAYGYSVLDIEDGYEVRVCGVPANDGQTVDFYLTNPADNDVWLRAEVLDEEDQVLGSTGIIVPGEYVTSICLETPLVEDATPVKLRIIAYEPDTWQSRGNVSLQTTIYKNYS